MNHEENAHAEIKTAKHHLPSSEVDVEQVQPQPTANPTKNKLPETPEERLERRMSIFEVWMITLTILGVGIGVVTGVIFYKQLDVMRGQLHEMKTGSNDTHALAEAAKSQAKNTESIAKATETTMRIDQRAWITVSFISDIQLQDGAPVLVPIHLVNTGKTPARNVAGDFVVSLLQRGEEPRFVYITGYPRTKISAGAVFPNVPMDFSAAMLPLLPQLPRPKRILLTHAMREEINTGQSYIVVHGKVTYDDVFGANHWLTFCWQASGDERGGSKKCVAHNDVDNN